MIVKRKSRKQSTKRALSQSNPGSRYAKKRRLFRRMNAGNDDTLLLKVAHILNYYPATRDSDITLSIKLLKTFYPSFIQPDDSIRLANLYKIPKFYDMQRHRARLQNSYRVFLASPRVRAFRNKRQFEEAEQSAKGTPDFSPVFVFADESGKNDTHLIIGSLWLYSADEHRHATKSLANWRQLSGVKSEVHFKTIKNVEDGEAASNFFDTLIASTPLHAFKALIVRNDRIPASRRLDAIYDAFGEILIDGMKSEISTQRLSVPLTLHLTKDADPSTDMFKMRDLNRKLPTAFIAEFPNGDVTLDANRVNSTPSEASDLMQIADLFAGSLNRWLNHGISVPPQNPKDKFASYVGSKFNWQINQEGRLSAADDVCKIIYLDN